MGKSYILGDNHELIETASMDAAGWLVANPSKRVVEKTTVGECEVSTIFLSFDHQYGQGPPLIFETMVFGGSLDGEQERYSTWDEAMAGHKAMVERCKRGE